VTFVLLRRYRGMDHHPASTYLRLAEGPDDLLESQLSLTRRLLTFLVAFVLFTGTSLFATAAFDLDAKLIGKAVASSGSGKDGGDDDDSGPGGGGDDDDDSDDSHSDENGNGNTDSSHGKQASDSNSDDNHNGNTDSSKANDSEDSNSDDNHNGNTDSSKGASHSGHSKASDDTKGSHSRG
jgi:hypothetical protein